MNFVRAMSIAQHGLDAWRAKPHNARWWKRIDGTPIPNDLLVCIAEQYAQDHTPTQFAYDAACKALWHWRDEAERLGKLARETPRRMDQ